MVLKTLDTLNVQKKCVLVRADFNISVENGSVVDDFRIRATLPTIRALKAKGARAVLLCSHMGHPRRPEAALTLRPVAEHLSRLLGESVGFVPDCVGEGAEHAAKLADGGSVVLLENLRFHEGEATNDPEFGKMLAALADCFVNDAFGVSHRAHASLVRVPAFLPSAAGMLLQREIEVLSGLLEHPKAPFVAVIGGAKIADKIGTLKRLLPNLSGLCLGGAIANTILKAKGVAVGRSRVDEADRDAVRSIILTDTKLHLPIDVIVSADKTGAGPVRTCGVANVRENELILDIGPDTQRLFSLVIGKAETVFWNGPVGLAEVNSFRQGTDAVVRSIVESDAFTVVGGGDTTRYPFQMGVEDKIGFLSTGGGAMLEFLSGAVLPGIRALEQA